MNKTQARESARKGFGILKGIVEKAVDISEGGKVELHIVDKPPKVKMTTARKRNIIAERESVCEGCGEIFYEWIFEVHHIIPREYKESTDEKENLMVLCANCHREYSHRWDELRRKAKKGEKIELTRKQMRELGDYIVT